MQGMILCAGLGTRFRPHTEKLAKPAIPFLGVPLAGYPLYYLEKLGIEELVVNTHHLPDTVTTAIDNIVSSHYQVTYFNETPEILGSGGGLVNARAPLSKSEEFVVINGDEVFFHPKSDFLNEMLEAHRERDALCSLLVMRHPGAGSDFGGVAVSPEGFVNDLGVQGDPAELWHNCGVYIYSKKIFDFLPPSGESHIFKQGLLPAITKGERVYAHRAPEEFVWLDTGSEAAYLDSTRQALGLMTSPVECSKTLKAVLKRFDKTLVDHGKGFWTGVGTEFSGDLKVNGFGLIGTGAKFSAARLENSVVAPGASCHENLKDRLFL